MPYYTAVYRPINEFILDEPCVYLNDDTGFYVHIWHTRYFLVKNKLLISELVNGQGSLDKNYKGSFEYWIEKVRHRHVQKVKKLKEYIDQINKDLQTIENVWKITHPPQNNMPLDGRIRPVYVIMENKHTIVVSDGKGNVYDCENDLYKGCNLKFNNQPIDPTTYIFERGISGMEM